MRKHTDDDGRTVADMNVEGVHGYVPPEEQRKRDELAALELTKAEKKAMRRASAGLILKAVGIICLIGAVSFAVLYLWLTACQA